VAELQSLILFNVTVSY